MNHLSGRMLYCLGIALCLWIAGGVALHGEEEPSSCIYQMELTPANLADIDARQNVILVDAELGRAVYLAKNEHCFLDLKLEVCLGKNIEVRFDYRSADGQPARFRSCLRYALGEVYCDGPTSPSVKLAATPQWQTASCVMQFPAKMEEAMFEFVGMEGAVQLCNIRICEAGGMSGAQVSKTIAAPPSSASQSPAVERVTTQLLPTQALSDSITRAMVEKLDAKQVDAPVPTAEELAAVAVPRVARPVEMKALPGNELQVTGQLKDGKKLSQKFSVPPLTVRQARNEKVSDLGTSWRALSFTKSCYGGVLKDSLVLSSEPDGKGTVYELDKDYLFDFRLSKISGKKGRALPPTVYLSCSYRFQRLDVLVLNERNELEYRVGKEARIFPMEPACADSDVRLGVVYLSPDTVELADGNLLPVTETAYPVKITPMAERLLPKTMAKLRSGEPLHILAWGDSVTAITYEIPDWKTSRWQAQFVAGLKKRFPKANIKLTTEAWGGRNSLHYLDPNQNPGPGKPHNYRERVLDRKPDLIVSEWSNDRWMTYDHLNGEQGAYWRMLRDFRQIGAEWIAIIAPYGSPNGPFDAASQKNLKQRCQYVSYLRQFGPANGVPVADVSARYDRLPLQGIPTLARCTWGVHPDGIGLKPFAEALLDIFPQQ